MEILEHHTEALLHYAASVAADALAEAHAQERPRTEGVRAALTQLGFLAAAAEERGDELAAGVYQDVAHETRRIYAGSATPPASS